MLKRGPFCSFQLGNEQQLCARIANSHSQFEASFTKVQGCSELELVSGPSRQHWRLLLCASGLSPIRRQSTSQTLKHFLVKELYKNYATQLTFWPLRQDFVGKLKQLQFTVSEVKPQCAVEGKSKSFPGGHTGVKFLHSRQGFYMLWTLWHLTRGDPTPHSNMSNYSFLSKPFWSSWSIGDLCWSHMAHGMMSSHLPLKQPDSPVGHCVQQ